MAEALVAQVDPVEYPTSDGRPVAETDLHYLRLAGAAYGIRRLLASRDDVYVGSNLLVYDEPGNPLGGAPDPPVTVNTLTIEVG